MFETLLHRRSRHFHNQTRVHEINFCMLQKLLPDPQTLHGEVVQPIGDASHLIIRIKEYGKYTTVLSLCIKLKTTSPLVSDMVFEVRIYHDACVAEATHYQGHGRFDARYPQQNSHGYHEDEKHQANRLLQECLKYCLTHLTCK